MKSKSTLRMFLLGCNSLLAISAANAQVYWDTNSTASGFGTASGTWGSDAFWNSSTTGGSGTFTTATTGTVNFGNGATGLGAGIINVGTVTASGDITFASGSGAIVLSGGTIDLAAAATINVHNTAGDTINSILTGAGTSLTITPYNNCNLTLSGDNSYTGVTIVNSGGGTAPALTVAHNNALGTTAGGTTVFGSSTFPYGARLNLADGITVTGETLTLDPNGNNRATLITSDTATWAGNVVLNGTTGTLAFAVDSATANLTVGSSAANTVTGSRTFLLRGEFAGTGTVKSTIQDGTSGANNVAKAGLASTWVLTAANTYTGTTNISAGTLSINSILNVNGGASAVGAPTTITDGTIGMGGGTNSGTLIYTGVGNTTDRVINLAGTSGAATLDQSGSGLLKFTSDFTATGAGTKTLTLQGSTAGTGEIAGAIVNNSSTNVTRVTKSGTGTWTLSGTNTYTGQTNINAGKLIVNGNISASTLTTVQTGATLGGSGTVGKTLVNGTLAVGNSPGQMNFTDTLGFNGVTIMEIDGLSGAGVTGGHDFVNLTGVGAAGVLTYGGTMTLDIGVLFVSGTYSWNLFDMASETGTFTGITLADKYSGSFSSIGSGVWSASTNDGNESWTFTESTGVLGLAVVPEPNVAALLGGLGTLMLLRRRRH